MKTGIHPQWFNEAKVVCACGSIFVTGSTQESIRVEICSKCHPFFTGQQKFADTLGQVDKFQKQAEKAKEKAKVKEAVFQRRVQKQEKAKGDKPSLKDLLMQARKGLHS